jgi:hypothetical protein
MQNAYSNLWSRNSNLNAGKSDFTYKMDWEDIDVMEGVK